MHPRLPPAGLIRFRFSAPGGRLLSPLAERALSALLWAPYRCVLVDWSMYHRSGRRSTITNTDRAGACDEAPSSQGAAPEGQRRVAVVRTIVAVRQRVTELVRARFGVLGPLRGTPGDHQVVHHRIACAWLRFRAGARTHGRTGREPLPHTIHLLVVP